MNQAEDSSSQMCEQWWLFPPLQGYWEKVQTFIVHLGFFFFFLKERLYIFHSLGQNQSMVAQHAETTVVKCSMRSRVSARFLIGSNAMPGQWHCQPTLTLMGQGCMQVKV